MSALHDAARRVVSAWVSTRPAWIEQCNEAVLALDAALKAQPEPAQEPAGCETEADCTSQPWCRISGECHRKQKPPGPAQEPITRIFGTLPVHDAQQPEPAQEPIGWLNGDDEYADFMHRELARIHQQRGSSTPKFFTIPVYTKPFRSKPLTDEEIVDAVREADLDWQAGWTLDEHEPNRFTTLARAIERKVRGA